MLKLVSFHIHAHLNAFLQILEYFSQSVEVDGLSLLAYSVFDLFDCAGCILYTLPFNMPPKERSRQALDRLPLVSNFLTNFWTQHFDGARLSPNSVRNAVWHALNEPVCQYLRTRNRRCSTVYIDNSLGPLARDSPCICSVGRTFIASAPVDVSATESKRFEVPLQCFLCLLTPNTWLARNLVTINLYNPCVLPSRTLTSKRRIKCIYSTNITNIVTEYFKHDIYSPFFSLQNAVSFIILTYLVPALFTFYIQVC